MYLNLNPGPFNSSTLPPLPKEFQTVGLWVLYGTFIVLLIALWLTNRLTIRKQKRKDPPPPVLPRPPLFPDHLPRPNMFQVRRDIETLRISYCERDQRPVMIGMKNQGICHFEWDPWFKKFTSQYCSKCVHHIDAPPSYEDVCC